MNAKFIFLLLVGLAVLLGIIADVLFKSWALRHRTILLTIGLLLYFTGTVFWAISLRYEYLSRAVSFFTVLNMLAVVLAGVFFFQEQLSLVNKIG